MNLLYFSTINLVFTAAIKDNPGSLKRDIDAQVKT